MMDRTNLMNTRIDKDINTFLTALTQKEEPSPNDFQMLLDALRTKFDLEAAYILEGLSSEDGLRYVFLSLREGESVPPEGLVLPMSHENYRASALLYDKEGLAEKSWQFQSIPDTQNVLHYGFFRGDIYDGAVGIKSLSKRRWTREEREAVKKVGRVLKGIVGNARSIWTEKEMRHQADIYQAQLADVLSTMGCGIIRYRESDKTVLMVNQTALDILGYDTREELELLFGFEGMISFVLEKDRPLMREWKESLQKVGDKAERDYRILRRNGELVYIHGESQLLMNLDGDRIYQQTFWDITEKELHEEELLWERAKRAMAAEEEKAEALEVSREHKEILMGLNQMLLDSYYIDLTTGECQTVGANCTDRFMDSPTGQYDDALVAFAESSVHEKDRESFLKICSREYVWANLTLETPLYSLAFRKLTEHGYLWYRMMMILSTMQEDGQTKKAILAFMDVDDVKRKEVMYQHRLEESNRNLKEALAQESEYKKALKEAYDTVMKANRAKSIFLSNMSHDMRTLMNGIVGMTAIAMKHADNSAKISRCLNRIETASGYLLQLINDVLDMGKIEAGKLSITREEISLNNVLESVIMLIYSRIRERRHTLTLSVTDVRHVSFIGDKLRLNQILMNLLNNAVKYTPEGGSIALEIAEYTESSTLTPWLRFTVRDNGIGMDEEFLSKVFEMFTQESAGARTRFQGTGLGLAIASNLVTLMDGTIEVTSKKGAGSAFTVRLPLTTSGMELPERAPRCWSICINQDTEEWLIPEPEASTHCDMETKSLSGYRFLVVEDNELNLEIMTEILEGQGAMVETAENGQIAVEKFRASAPKYYNLVFMDIKMPIMSGYQAAQQIRALTHPDARTVPIIALTADAFPEDVEKALNSGMNAHMAKPLNLDILYAQIEKYVVGAQDTRS